MYEVDGLEFLSAAECAKLARVHITTVYYWFRKFLPTVSTKRLGIADSTARILVEKRALEAFLEERGYARGRSS